MDSGWLGCRQLGQSLAEDLLHDLRASGKGSQDLVPVDQLGRGGLVVSSQQRYRFPPAHHAQTTATIRTYAAAPVAPTRCQPGRPGDLAKLPPDQFISNDPGRSGTARAANAWQQALRERQVLAHARADRRASGLSSTARNLSHSRPTAHARPHPPSTSLVTCAWVGDSGGVVDEF
jgi:hypothetical protein